MNALERFKTVENRTFADAASRYLDEFDGLSFSRQEHALSHVLPYIGHLKLIDVHEIEQKEYKSDRQKVAPAE